MSLTFSWPSAILSFCFSWVGLVCRSVSPSLRATLPLCVDRYRAHPFPHFPEKQTETLTQDLLDVGQIITVLGRWKGLTSFKCKQVNSRILAKPCLKMPLGHFYSLDPASCPVFPPFPLSSLLLLCNLRKEMTEKKGPTNSFHVLVHSNLVFGLPL